MEKIFTSSAEVFDWLSSFINLERGQKPKSFRIERMHALCELAGNPQKCAPSIHIAGSKGKGSVTGMLAAMLSAAGLRTARYMSPHVSDFRERVSLGCSFFEEDTYCAAADELKGITDGLLPDIKKILPHAAPLFDTETADGCEPTYWELLTLFFFLCARYAKCDIMVVETGLGGRLDSTNVLDPLISVITLIELEHTNYLGNTIKEIAGEKAGIIKQGKPVITAKQCGEALDVFKKAANKKNSPFFYLPQIADTSGINITTQGTDFSLSFNTPHSSLSAPHSSLFTPHSPLRIPIPGKVQAENAALAIAALKIAFPQIGEDAIQSGLSNLKIPARFEKISSNPAVIIDGAHTPESFSLCVETFVSLYGNNNVLLFGCAADKKAELMAKAAHRHFSKIIVTTPGTFKTSDPQNVFDAFVKEAGNEKIICLKDTNEAVKFTLDYSIKNNLAVLGAGSFYLVSEIRKFIFNSKGSE